MIATTEAYKVRRKRVFLRHQAIVDFYAANPSASTWDIARRFGCSHRAAQQHLKKIRQALE